MEEANRQRLSYDEYVRLESTNEDRRFEYYDGEVVALAEPSRAHEFIVSNLSLYLGSNVRDEGCFYVTRGAVWSAQKRHEVKPDWMALCDRRDLEGIGPEATRSRYRFPRMVVEVISAGNTAAEMEAKLACYSALGSVELYLVIDSLRRRIWPHVRLGEAIVPAPADETIDTPFGALTWDQIYERTGVPLLRASPLVLDA